MIFGNYKTFYTASGSRHFSYFPILTDFNWFQKQIVDWILGNFHHKKSWLKPFIFNQLWNNCKLIKKQLSFKAFTVANILIQRTAKEFLAKITVVKNMLFTFKLISFIKTRENSKPKFQNKNFVLTIDGFHFKMPIFHQISRGWGFQSPRRLNCIFYRSSGKTLINS